MPDLQQRETEEPWVGPWRAFLGMEPDDDWPDYIPPNVDCFAGGFAAGVAAAEAEYEVALATAYRNGAESRDEEIARLRAALERTLHNFEAVLARTPVRDAAETIAEARAALEGVDDAE